MARFSAQVLAPVDFPTCAIRLLTAIRSTCRTPSDRMPAE